MMCVGIACEADRIAVTTNSRPGGRLFQSFFPANTVGRAVVRMFCAGFRQPMRIVISGVRALDFALLLGRGHRREVILLFQPMPSAALAARAWHQP